MVRICRVASVFVLGLGVLGQIAAAEAPPLKTCRTEMLATEEAWDDLWQGGDFDLVARRDNEVFLLGSDGKRVSMGKFPRMSQAQIAYAGSWGGGRWLLCRSPERAPFAIELKKRKAVDFEIEGLKIPGKRTPEIQSWVVAPHAEAAVLMVAGGDRESWPRPGNRPIYFWLSFRTGKSRTLPTGWDLNHFSPDQTVAVFGRGGAGMKAIDMKTGKDVREFPDRLAERAPFSWTNKDICRPLIKSHHTQVGLTAFGRPQRFESPIDSPYIFSSKVRGDWVAFHLRGHGEPRKELHSLWLLHRKPESVRGRLSTDVKDFALFADGRCLYTATGFGREQRSSEAFVYDAQTATPWNVLEGVDRLPKLPPKLAKAPHITDQLQVRLIEGYGNAERRLMLALYTHSRYEPSLVLDGGRARSPQRCSPPAADLATRHLADQRQPAF